MTIDDIIEHQESPSYPITLNKVLEKLKDCSQDKPVLFAFKGQYHEINRKPVNAFCSWRGSYSEPTCYGNGSEECTTKELIQRVKDFIGSTQYGWKGGEYIMDGDSGLWADESGRYAEKGVIDVVECDDCVAFVVAQCSY